MKARISAVLALCETPGFPPVCSCIRFNTSIKRMSSSVVYMVMSPRLLTRLVPGRLERLPSSMDSTTKLFRLVAKTSYKPGLPAIAMIF